MPAEHYPYVVSEIGMFHVKLYPLDKNPLEQQHIEVDLHGISPIQLTEEWLLKFGFEWNKETKTYEHKDFYPWHVSKSINIDIQNWQVFNYVLKAVANRKIKYVHQLQNLYFALTGEELKEA